MRSRKVFSYSSQYRTNSHRPFLFAWLENGRYDKVRAGTVHSLCPAVDSFTAESRISIERLLPSASRRSGRGPKQNIHHHHDAWAGLYLLHHELLLPFSFCGCRKPFLQTFFVLGFFHVMIGEELIPRHHHSTKKRTSALL